MENLLYISKIKKKFDLIFQNAYNIAVKLQFKLISN